MIDQLRSTQGTSKLFEKTTRITANPNEQPAKKKNGPPKNPRDVETSAIAIFSSIDFGNIKEQMDFLRNLF